MTVVELNIPGLRSAERIGKGGNGSVYRAFDTDHDRWIAVKVLHGLQDEVTLRRFDRERKTMGRLSAHEGIVTILTSGVSTAGEPYLVMPLLTDGSLADELHRRGPVPWAEAVATVSAVADAVAAAHAANVIHRDLKPGNILLGPGGRPLVADFGISQILEAGVVGTSRLMVSPPYTAPDLFDQPPPASIDVYALGATLYEMAVGQPPYVEAENENIISFLGRVREEPLPDLHGFDIPVTLVHLLEASLAKVAAGRPSSMGEFAASLRTTLDVIEPVGGGDGPTSRAAPTVAAPAEPTVADPAEPTVAAPEAGPTVAAPAEPTVAAPEAGPVDPTVAAPTMSAPQARPGPEPDLGPIIDWHPHIDLAVEVDDVAATTAVVAEGVAWCFSHQAVFLIVSIDDGRFVQVLVEQNGDAAAETSRSDLALQADLGWQASVAGHEEMAEAILPLGVPRREEAIVELLVSTLYRVHGFDHSVDIAVQTGQAGSGSPVLGVVFERDTELETHVADANELAELVWHSVLWSRSTRQVAVTLDVGPAATGHWQRIITASSGHIELQTSRPPGGAPFDPALGWQPDPSGGGGLRQELPALGETTEPRAFEVLTETFHRGHGVILPAPVRIVIASVPG